MSHMCRILFFLFAFSSGSLIACDHLLLFSSEQGRRLVANEKLGSLHLFNKERELLVFHSSQKEFLATIKRNIDKWAERVEFLEAYWGKLESPLKIQLGSTQMAQGEMRSTGYDFEARILNFLENRKTVKGGLNADDVITHEMLHAFICQKKPALCTIQALKENKELTAFHEFWADYYALLYKHNLNFDSVIKSKGRFGEGFYRDFPYVRESYVDFEWGLVDQPYDQARVLFSRALNDRISLKSLGHDIQRIEAGSLAEELEAQLLLFRKGPSFSILDNKQKELSLLKFWLNGKGGKTQFHFVPNEALQKAYPKYQIKWVRSGSATSESPEFFKFRQLNSGSFEVEARDSGKIEAIWAEIWSQDKNIGRYKFYFGSR